MYQIKKTTNLLLLFTLISFAGVASAAPLGNSFTYQGRLIDADQAADGLYDFQFKLYDANSGGSKLASDVNKADIDVIDGYFTVEIDFGNVFDGSARWLEIGVRPGDENDPNVYTTLDPRQRVTPAPYALKARGVSGMDSNNTLLGESVGSGGTCNTFAGYQAGYSNTGSWNTFLGYLTGRSNTANYNIFIGDKAGYSNTWGYCNTYIGHCAGYSASGGFENTFTGYLAGYNNTGHSNTLYGYRAGINNTSGNDNTFIGYLAGPNNVTGSGNVFIGYGSGYNETGSDKLYIDNDSSGALIYGDFSTGRVGINTTTVTRNLNVNDTMRLIPRATAPASPAEGDIYMDSSTHKLMVYDGTTWRACW